MASNVSALARFLFLQQESAEKHNGRACDVRADRSVNSDYAELYRLPTTERRQYISLYKLLLPATTESLVKLNERQPLVELGLHQVELR